MKPELKRIRYPLSGAVARRRALRAARRVLDPRQEAERLRLQALDDPADPGLWGLYAGFLQEQALIAKRARVRRTDKPALIDPLILGQSRLQATLRDAPPAVYPEDRTPEDSPE